MTSGKPDYVNILKGCMVDGNHLSLTLSLLVDAEFEI